MVYLDNAATTLHKPPAVYQRVARALKYLGSPGRGGHRYAMEAAEVAFTCRERAAKLFSVPDPQNVVLTFNATHGLNIAIVSLVKPGMRVLTTGFEHNSVLRPLRAVGAGVVPVGQWPFDPDAMLHDFKRRLSEGADAAVINHVSNVFGCIQPLEEIAKLCREYEVPLIVDASQSAGTLDLDMERLGAAFMAMPGHKGLYGPQGTGLLLCAADTRPLLHGGSGSDSLPEEMPDYLPDRLEAGTHNMPGVAGLAEGLRYVIARGPEKILDRERSQLRRAVRGLGKLPGYTLYTAPKEEDRVGVLSFSLEGVSTVTLGERFAREGIALRAGLHCAPMAHRTAGTLPGGTVRMSLSDFTSDSDVAMFLQAAKRIGERAR